jgi:hypothetical protein
LEITGKYLMSFHACPTGECQSGPLSHQVYLAQSDDGANWSLVPGWQPYPGSVPDVIRRGDTLYFYTPGKVARYHLDTKTFDNPTAVQIEGAPDGFVDPSLILDDQGRLVLFFLFGRLNSDPATCPAGQTSCEQVFGSATEAEGSDGARFTLDDGNRASVILTTGGSPRSASDPDVFFDGEQYVLLISHGPGFSLWTSPDLRGTYASASASMPNGLFAENSPSVPSGYFDPATKRYWLYGHRSMLNDSAVISLAVIDSLSSPPGLKDWVVTLSAESLGLGSGINVESPGFAANQP